MRKLLTLSFCVCVVGALAAPVHGQTAGMLSFQGVLKDANGNLVNGPVDLEFRIFDAQTGGNLVDMDGDGVVEDVVGEDVKTVLTTATLGVVSCEFGPCVGRGYGPWGVGGSIFGLDHARWLEVRVNDGSPLPRVDMTSTTRSLFARASERLIAADMGAVAMWTHGDNGSLNIPGDLTSSPGTNLAFVKNWPVGGRIGLLCENRAGWPAPFYVKASNMYLSNTELSVLPDDNGSPVIQLKPNGHAIAHAFEVYNDLDVSVAAIGHYPDGSGYMYARDEVGDESIRLYGNSGTIQGRVVQITGGSDLAEPFAVANSSDGPEKIEPGMVVVIDPDNPGQLKLATGAYDRKVAGIISGAKGLSPGMVMQADGISSGGSGQPVALTGRIYVWADASYGAITPGDMLTTSDTPGHAMRASEPGQSHLIPQRYIRSQRQMRHVWSWTPMLWSFCRVVLRWAR